MGMFDFIGGIGGDIGGSMANTDTADERAKQKEMLDQVFANAQGLDTSKITDMGPSAFDKLNTDPRTRNSEMTALNNLSNIATSGGLDPQSRAAEFEAEQKMMGAEGAKQSATEQALEARGLGGSGADIAGAMSAGQSGANSGALASMQSAADARTRALSALGDMGSMAGKIRGQDYSEAARHAEADDARSRFNANQSLNRFGAGVQKVNTMNSTMAPLNDWYKGDIGRTYAQDVGLGKDIGNAAGGIANMATMGVGGGGGGGGGALMMSNGSAPSAVSNYNSSLSGGGDSPYNFGNLKLKMDNYGGDY